ncbi:MAG: ATP-binding protein [Myxococcaceae bacterium]|jgi:signal transduction histidine kinase/ActR/RegA family two-component response regulator|nr:ATP-binding protein [Myxococcaceae bacterium]
MAGSSSLTLSRWTWRAFLRNLLAPLVLVELVLLGAYLLTGIATHTRNVATMEGVSRDELTRLTSAESRRLDAKLDDLEQLTHVLAARTREAWTTPFTPPAEVLETWSVFEGGVYRSTRDVGFGSMFASGITPLTAEKRARAARLAQLIPMLRELRTANPSVVQAYVNTTDSVNVIFPAIDTSSYPASMNIPSYNFFYEADAAHNPSRGVVFTDAYLDPAGAGWIVSAIAPVYDGDTLLAVVGLDVTLAHIVNDVLKLDVPWGGYGVLVDRHGTLLAVPAAAEADFGVKELVDHTYVDVVGGDTLKPDAFKLSTRPALAPLAEALTSSPSGLSTVTLSAPRLVGWATIPSTRWRLAVVVPTERIFESANTLKREALETAALLGLGIFAFYVVFLVVVYRRSQRETAMVTEPLQAMRQLVRAIAGGSYRQEPPKAAIAELDELGRDLASMGVQLEAHLDALARRDEALRAARASEAAAQAAAHARGAFLANMSHEIRTPMNGVLGMLELALLAERDPSQRRTLETALKSGQSLLGLINDILDASKIDSGQLRLETIPFSLRGLLDEVTQLFRPLAAQKELEVVLEVAPEVPVGVQGDPTRLRQVLSNLLGNAVKFTTRGRVGLRVRRDGERLRFEVHDSGIGIPKERQAAVFDAFTQADESTTRRFGGTGLGLSISARLVAMMGGHLDVVSEPGVGSTFSFTLALPDVLVVTPDAQAPAAAAVAGRRLRVLAAEDNVINQQVLRRMLERLGHELVLVSNGVEALAEAKAGRFDVALFDVHMPELDGLDLTRAIRAAETPEFRLPVLALTASAMVDDVRACQDAGMDDVLPKPYALSELDRKLRELTSAEPRGAAA